MAIVAAAVVPHSPLLIPTIAKKYLEQSTQTLAALSQLGRELYAVQPDVVVILTPHGAEISGAVAIEIGDTLTADLHDFGDLQTKADIRGAVGLAHQLKEAAEDVGVPLLLQSRQGLDYGVTVPWITLWPESVHFPLIPLSIHRLTMDEVIRLGHLLHDFFQGRPERVILIASGDTDRRSPNATSADRRPTTAERKVSEAIATVEVSRLAELLPPRMCLTEPLAVVLASLQGLSTKGNIVSFEVPVAVGQLIASFELHG